MDSHVVTAGGASSDADDCWGSATEDRLAILDSKRFAMLDSEYDTPFDSVREKRGATDDRLAAVDSNSLINNGKLLDVASC